MYIYILQNKSKNINKILFIAVLLLNYMNYLTVEYIFIFKTLMSFDGGSTFSNILF